MAQWLSERSSSSGLLALSVVERYRLLDYEAAKSSLLDQHTPSGPKGPVQPR
jgi:hypothetical protein